MGMMMLWIGYRPKTPHRGRIVCVHEDGLRTGEVYPYEQEAMEYKVSLVLGYCQADEKVAKKNDVLCWNDR